MAASSPEFSKKQVGERLRALRRRRGITQYELADILGANQSHISNVERGARGLTVEQVVKIAGALRAPTDDLLLGSRKTPGKTVPLRSGKLLRCLQQIEDLPAADQRAVLRLLEGILARHQMAQGKLASSAVVQRDRRKVARRSKVA